MKVLSNYIPMDRRVAYNQGKELPDKARGTAMFADISGFTPLTDSLVKELGVQRGAEVVTEQLNRVYGSIIEEVHRFHGSVISFSGDAITCWFDQDEGWLAVACALAIQKVMEALSTFVTVEGSQIALGIKVAVVGGVARRFVVGNPDDQFIDVLAGSLLDRVASCEVLLNRGEIGLGHEIVLAMGDRISIKEWRGNQDEERVEAERFAIVQGDFRKSPPPPKPWQTVPTVHENIAKQWVLPAVYDRLHLGKGRYLAELRSSIALFIKFSGINYDEDEKSGEKLDRFIRYCQQVLSYYEGELWQVTVGDKGSYVYAGFGALTTHEDDSVRVVSASLELRNMPPDLNYIRGIQIGISKGQVYAGWYGGTNRQTYATLGNEVNIAARLMTKAKTGEILLSTKVARLVEQQFELKALKPVLLKGVDQPMLIFSVLKPKEKRPGGVGQTILPMFGRFEEKSEIKNRLNALAHGEGGTLIIEGEAGIGKSRLLQELLQQAEKRDFQVFMGHGDAVEKNTPYLGFRSLLQALFSLDEDEEEKESVRKIFENIGDDPYLKERIPLLTEILPVNIDDNELTLRMSGEVRKDNIIELILSILNKKRWSETSPLILIFDDSQWLDSVSWPVVLRSSLNFSSMLLVLVTRPMLSPLPVEYSTLLNAPDTTHIVLDSLPSDAIKAMLCQRLGVREISREVGNLIQEKAEGHPFFSEEMAYVLRDSGKLLIEEGERAVLAKTKDGVDLRVPDTIQGIIMSRIDQLPSSMQVLLKVASVIGRVFSTKLLKAVHPVTEEKGQLDHYLQKLEARKFTFPENKGAELAYIFKHIITQQVAYNLLLYSQRQELHQLVAKWYENDFKGDLSSLYPLLAYHWRKANVWDKALDYLEKAGNVGMNSYANHEAIRFFKEILELVRFKRMKVDPLRRCRWEFSLGKAYLNISQHSKAKAHLEKSLKLLNRPMPKGEKRLILRLILNIIRQFLFRTILPPNNKPVVNQDLAILEIHILESLGLSHFLTGKMGISMYTSLRALNRSEKTGLSPERATRYIVEGLFCGTISKHKWADWYIKRGLETMRKLDDSLTFIRARGMAALYYAGTGKLHWETAETLYNKTLEKANKFGDNYWKGLALSSITELYYQQGKTELSEEYMEKFHLFAQKSMDPMDLNVYRNYKSRNLLLEDKHEEALQELLHTIPTNVKAIYILQQYYAFRAETLLRHSMEHGSDSSRFREYLSQIFDKVELFLAINDPTPIFVIASAFSSVLESMRFLLEFKPEELDIDYLARKFRIKLKQFSTQVPIGLPIYWQRFRESPKIRDQEISGQTNPIRLGRRYFDSNHTMDTSFFFNSIAPSLGRSFPWQVNC